MHATDATRPAIRGPRGPRGLLAAVACALLLAALAAPARCQAPAAPAAPAAPGTGSPAGRPRGRLLKVPKVYNALITSNEPLLPSRTEQATVGQVLYYPPQHHHGYPASSGPLILPQVAAQSPASLGPGPGPGLAPQTPQPPVSLPAQQPGPSGPALELHLQGPQDGPGHAGHPAEQTTHWPVVYASDVSQPRGYSAGDADQYEAVQQYAAGDAGQSEAAQQYAAGDTGQSEAAQQYAAGQSEVLQRYTAGIDGRSQPALPAARDVQTAARVAEPRQYRPPPTVHIDSIKNNRPAAEGIRDVPPPPLPAGRGRRPTAGPQPLPPGILPF